MGKQCSKPSTTDMDMDQKRLERRRVELERDVEQKRATVEQLRDAESSDRKPFTLEAWDSAKSKSSDELYKRILRLEYVLEELEDEERQLDAVRNSNSQQTLRRATSLATNRQSVLGTLTEEEEVVEEMGPGVSPSSTRAAPAIVTQLCDMGFPRAEVERCLAAGLKTPRRAVEYLTSGSHSASSSAPNEVSQDRRERRKAEEEALRKRELDRARREAAEEGAVAAGAGRGAEGGSAEEVPECCICLDREKSHAFLPCGHRCACMDCAAIFVAGSSLCPICRKRVEGSVQIFV